MNRLVNGTIAVFFTAIAAGILSCEIPTDGGFGGAIRGTSEARPPTLAAPKNVQAVEGTDEGTIAITWNAVSGADGYLVYRSKNASPQASLRGGVSQTAYLDSGKSVAPNTPYYYFVSAYKGGNESALSPSKVIELSAGDPGILPAPEIAGAEGADTGITLAWTAVAGAAEYRIYRSSNYDDRQYLFKHKGAETTYHDTSLAPGEYVYQVSAVNTVGQEGYLSQPSDWVPIAADEEDTPPSVPPAPQSVRARMDEPRSITLTWQAAEGAARYYVMRSEDGETYTEIGFAEGETSYTNRDTDAAAPVCWGGIYYYRVKPYNGSWGGYLSQACGPVVVQPAQPVITSVTGAAANLTLNWTIEGKADGFRIYRSTNGIQYEILKTAGRDERAYTDTSAGLGRYYYRITAYNSGGAGLDSATREVDVAAVETPLFVPVSGITGVPETAQAGVPLTLQGAVQPSGATNKAITWAVKDAGGTGASIGSGNTLTATATGTVTVTATIANGLAPGVSYTEDFEIAVSLSFVPVSGITGVPETAQAGVPLTLQGTVQPSGATNKTIVWTVKTAGGTDASVSGSTLTTTAAGTVTLTATIDNGLAPGVSYTEDFEIAVSANTFNAASGAAFASALSSIVSSGEERFTVTVGADMSLAPQDLTLPAYADKTIVLKGDAPARTVSLSFQGSLFTVGAGVTLELEDIVLEGRSDNTAPLVKVNVDGKLALKTGGKITGNTYTT